MRFKCLVLDHDDTVFNSTATIHYPCFIKYLTERLPHLANKYTLEDYFVKNFDPGVIALFRDEVGLTEDEMREEEEYWKEYVKDHIPAAYEGISDILDRFRAEGGIIAVASHSFKRYIERDYLAAGLPIPDCIYGWDLAPELRKPSPYTVLDIMENYSLSPSDILVVDDLKPGFDMARTAGVAFAAAGWAYDVESIENFMREHCDYYLKEVGELSRLLFS